MTWSFMRVTQSSTGGPFLSKDASLQMFVSELHIPLGNFPLEF